MSRKVTILERHPNCHFCDRPIGDIDTAFITPNAVSEQYERLVHAHCFVKAICRVNPTFSKRVAQERAKRAGVLVA